jgi:hypothetical protein
VASESIFLRTKSGLEVLRQSSYDSEDVLQTALAEHPEVLAGSTTAGDTDSGLLLLRREVSVSGQGGSAPFSLDHLFLDGDAVPVLVEVKRSSDSRVRREVVGQMLDHAANALTHWPVEVLQQALEARASAENRAEADLLQDVAPGVDVDDFWRDVDANLRAGRIRMVFVADELPPDLVRVIEFLNEQMTPAEVLGVELRQFTGGGHTAYVPTVVGRTTYAVARKAGRSGQVWDRRSFLDAADSRCRGRERDLVDALLKDVDDHGVRLSWGKGVSPGVGGWYRVAGEPVGTWALNLNTEDSRTGPYLYFFFPELSRRLGATRMERVAEALERIGPMREKVADARASGWQKYPSVFLREIADHPDMLDRLFLALAQMRIDRLVPGGVGRRDEGGPRHGDDGAAREPALHAGADATGPALANGRSSEFAPHRPASPEHASSEGAGSGAAASDRRGADDADSVASDDGVSDEAGSEFEAGSDNAGSEFEAGSEFDALEEDSPWAERAPWETPMTADVERKNDE